MRVHKKNQNVSNIFSIHLNHVYQKTKNIFKRFTVDVYIEY